MNNILERVRRFGAIRHDKEGRIKMWGISGILFPNFSRVIQQEYLKRVLDPKQYLKMAYEHGKLHSYFTFKMLSDKYGYKQKLKDPVRLLNLNLGQCEMVGAGKQILKKADTKKNVFVSSGNSTFAEEYRRLIGLAGEPVDHFLRGSFAAFTEAISGKEMFCVEKRCIAKGDPVCEFVSKPLEDWDRKDREFKKQFVQTPKTSKLLEELGFSTKKRKKI